VFEALYRKVIMILSEVLKKAVSFVFPEFTNKLTWAVVTAGIALLSSSFIEQIIKNFINSEFNFNLTDGNDAIIGLILVMAGLLHNYGFVREKNKEYVDPIEIGRIEREVESDKKLYQKLLTDLPFDGPILMLKEHDFLGSFNLDEIKPLNNFVYYWQSAEYTFVDDNLEKVKHELLEKVGEFTQAIAQYTSRNAYGFQAVRVDCQLHDPAHEARFREEAGIINVAASEAFDCHQKLIKECKIKGLV
jgi:hypothetical protein